jgi:hypothetical protein
MRSRWTALLLVLVFAGLTPRSRQAQTPPQTSKPKTAPVAVLHQNSPNPFNPETFIKFTLGDSACTNPSHRYAVSLTIYNVLHQKYAVPLVQRGSVNVAGGQPLSKLQLQCGDYTAYWDGKVIGTQKEAASGNYIAMLEVDGQRFAIKMLNVK